MKTEFKKSTIYFDPEIYKALRLKAVVTGISVSRIVNEAVKERLTEDDEDLVAFEERAREPNLEFEKVVKELTRNRLIN